MMLMPMFLVIKQGNANSNLLPVLTSVAREIVNLYKIAESRLGCDYGRSKECHKAQLMIRALVRGPGLIHLFSLHVLERVTQQPSKFWVFKLKTKIYSSSNFAYFFPL